MISCSDADYLRRERALAAENVELSARVEALSNTVAELHQAATASRASLRAALNLLEDALQGRAVAQRELAERSRIEDELREVDRRKDDFLATLSHELRSPLAPIRNAIALLDLPTTSDVGERERNGALTIMRRQVLQLVRLVDDLLEMSRFTRGKLRLHSERVDLADVVRSALETSKPYLDAAAHRVDLELPEAPIVLDADAGRLAQVFTNLLINAAKYSPNGRDVHVRARRVRDVAVVLVRDEGVGISTELLPTIFDLFTQGEHSAARDHGGLGIGLFLARTLVQLHGGTIEARSAGAGRGSEFEVRVPALPAEARVLTPPPSRRPPSLAGRTLLVVDDDVDTAETLSQVLTAAGASVSVAHDGSSALELVRRERPHIAILDVGMPGMDGYELARRVQAEFGGERPKLVALTGWGRDGDRQRTRDAGFDLHLLKPVDLPALLGALLAL